MANPESSQRQKYLAATTMMNRLRDFYTQQGHGWCVWQDDHWLYHGLARVTSSMVFRVPYPDPGPLSSTSNPNPAPRWYADPDRHTIPTLYWKNNYFWFYDEEPWTWNDPVNWAHLTKDRAVLPNTPPGKIQTSIEAHRLDETDPVRIAYQARGARRPPSCRFITRLRFPCLELWDGQGVLIDETDNAGIYNLVPYLKRFLKQSPINPRVRKENISQGE